MKQINKPVINLDTKIEVQLTIRELLNLAVATSNVAPSMVKNDMKDRWGYTEDEADNIIHSPVPYSKEEQFVLHDLPIQIRQILKDYGYTRKEDEDESLSYDY